MHHQDEERVCIVDYGSAVGKIRFFVWNTAHIISNLCLKWGFFMFLNKVYYYCEILHFKITILYFNVFAALLLQCYMILQK